MTLDERKINTNIIQNIILENREKATVSGVIDVMSFDDEVVILETELGLLTIKGDGLKLNKLSLDTSEVIIGGNIGTINYSEKRPNSENTSLLSKIFK